MLIEGDKVEYKKRTTTIIDSEDNETTFEYYEVTPLESYTTPVEGQADVIVYEVKPCWNEEHPCWENDIETDCTCDPQIGKPKVWQWNEIDSGYPKPPTSPNFEAVYLKLDIDRCTPLLVKAAGIVNDCTALRVRGVFIREDKSGRRYPMLFELPTLRAGGAIRAREVSCYYKTEHDKCAPITTQPEMQLVRMNDWRLTLAPNTCTVPSTAIVDIITNDNGTPTA